LEDRGVSDGRAGYSNTNNNGPGSGEYFYDNYNTYHQETALGGIFIYSTPTARLIFNNAYDPLKNENMTTGEILYAGGTTAYNLDNGRFVRSYIYYSSGGATNPTYMGKAAGLGDLVLMCNKPPLCVGDYVFVNTLVDGIQSPKDTGLAGVTVEFLFAPYTTVAATAITDANGFYSFCSTTAGLAAIAPGLTVRIRIPLTQTAIATPEYVPTQFNTGNDIHNSDGSPYIIGNYVVKDAVVQQWGIANNQIDFGFVGKLACTNCLTGHSTVYLQGPGVDGIFGDAYYRVTTAYYVSVTITWSSSVFNIVNAVASWNRVTAATTNINCNLNVCTFLLPFPITWPGCGTSFGFSLRLNIAGSIIGSIPLDGRYGNTICTSSSSSALTKVTLPTVVEDLKGKLSDALEINNTSIVVLNVDTNDDGSSDSILLFIDAPNQPADAVDTYLNDLSRRSSTVLDDSGLKGLTTQPLTADELAKYQPIVDQYMNGGTSSASSLFVSIALVIVAIIALF